MCPVVFARPGKLLVVTALVLATGLHWAALQTVAWTTMLAGNLCCNSFAQAVDKTFDGQHPCCLCRAIAAAQRSAKKTEAVSPVLKMEFPLLATPMVLIPPSPFEMVPAPDVFAEFRALPPLPPPPRNLPA